MLTLEKNKLVFTPPHHPHFERAIKHSLPVTKYGDSWVLDVSYHNTATQLAFDWNIEITEEVENLRIPDREEKTQILVTDSITIKTPYNPVANTQLSQFSKWNSKNKTWNTPTTNSNVVLTWADNHNIQLSSHIVNQLTQYHQHHTTNYNLSQALEHNMHVENLSLQPRKHQQAAIAYAVRNKKCFIADDMGLGKTLEAIGSAEHLNAYPVLVVSPATLTTDWKYKINEAVPHRTTHNIYGLASQDIPRKDYVIISYNTLTAHKEEIVNFNPQTIIYDESHYLKNSKSKRTQAAFYLTKNTNPQLTLCLTGTPIKNRPSEYASQLRILQQIQNFGGTDAFYKRYCGFKKTRYGIDVSGATNMEELQTKLRQTCYIRREKTEVLDLPPKTYNNIFVQQTTEQQLEYGTAQQQFAEVYNPSDTAQTLVQLAKLRSLTAKQKINHAIQWAKDAHEQGQKTVTAAYHRDIVKTLAAETSNLTIIGGQKDVEEHKKIFQEDPKKMNISISLLAAAHGHTLTAATHMLMIELPWTIADYEQAADRIYRIGQTQPVTIHNLIMEDTIDNFMYDIVLRKHQIIKPATTKQIVHQLAEALIMAVNMS